MSLDHDVTVGRSGLRVSPLCLGTTSVEQVDRLDRATTPTRNVPAAFLGCAGGIQNGGTTIDGEPAEASSFGVTKVGDHS